MKSDKEAAPLQISKFFYIALCLLSFCLLATEILLVRLLSIIFWYHFVFLVVSVALFGLTVGALIVYLASKVFLLKSTKAHITIYSYISSIAILISLLSLFYLPAKLSLAKMSYLLMPFLYVILALPFITIGINLALCLTRFPEHIGKIYSSNLIGSALGCIGAIVILNVFNGPSAILFLACLTALSALLFALDSKGSGSLKLVCILTMVFFALLALKNGYSNSIRPSWTRGSLKRPAFYDKWNFFSYITIRRPSRRPFGWGFSPNIVNTKIRTQELMLLIDEGAGTVLTRFNNLSDLEYLKLDVSASVYHIRDNADVLVIGSGGGRDLLTARLFGAKKIVGVEINKDIVDTVFNKLKDFSGNISRYPEISVVTEEGRSFVSGSGEKYNVIQASMVDSFAAFANGAFALTENSLYTKEAWVIFLNHLKEDGILTFTRWYFKDDPTEIYRILTLANSSLREIGIKDTRKNIALVRYIWPRSRKNMGVGTILVSRTPFTQPEIERLRSACNDLKFELVLSPNNADDSNFISILQNVDDTYQLDNISANINPPTDDKPFFFYFSRFKSLFAGNPQEKGVIVLRKLFLMILIFAVFFILVPSMYQPRTKGFSDINGYMVAYFSSIGLGFMLIEIPLMQRLGIFLGHPIYGLTVVLFSLLFSCGVGSYLTKYLNTGRKAILPFIALLILIFMISSILPAVVKISTPYAMTMKILISVVVLVFMGLFMGMPFPLAMKIAGKDEKSPRVLYWGINGFTSVCGSACALVILINFGFKMTMLTGFICYLVALLALLPNLKNINS